MPRTPQFASTPRFLLSQRGPPPSSSFSASRPSRPEPIDEDDSPQNTPLAKRVRGRRIAATPASATRQPATQRAVPARDVIEDSEDDESGLSGGEVDSELEAEFEALFGETRTRSRSIAKRRRVDEQEEGNDVEEEDPKNREDADSHDHERDQQATEDPNDAAHDEAALENNHNRHPDPSPDENIPSSPLKPPSTPYPNPHRPRFLLSASSQLHTPSQAPSQFHPPSSTKPPTYTNPSEHMTPTVPTSTAPDPVTRRKPTFVLPRSPSPDTALDDGVPLLFSPSRTQRRRGRLRGSGQGYVAGGMAEQVRGWVLEMGVKGGYRGDGLRDLDAQRYAFVVRIEEVQRSVMGSCGELVFVRGVDGRGGGVDGDPHGGGEVRRNVLLMGAPQSRNMDPGDEKEGGIPDLKPGDRVGIGRGLVWDVELDAMGESMSGEMEKWSVCMEWDVL